MAFRKEQFVNGEICHVVLRAVDDKILFKDDDDHYRMIFSIYEFNDARLVTIRERRIERLNFKKQMRVIKLPMSGKVPDIGSLENLEYADKRERLVEVLCFKLMPNHIHLLIRQLKDGGISKFMQKLGIGYTKYFNEKYQRKGHLFQGAFRAVHIENDEQLKTVFVYIHTNGISLIEPGWREEGIKDPDKVIDFSENDKWSSYADYLGKKNFPSVTKRDFILEIMGSSKGCKEFVDNWVKYKAELKDSPDVSLE